MTGLVACPAAPITTRRRQRVFCAATEGNVTQQLPNSKNGRNRIPSPPYKVVITGSTKGIGYELAREFLRNGDDVIISSRNYSNVRSAVKELHNEFGYDQFISGVTCDVSSTKELMDMADYARSELGSIHIWINNAGSNAYKYETLQNFSEAELRQIIDTNLLGTMLASRQAVEIMRYQEEQGHIFSMDGAGGNGRPTPQFAAYGATKASLKQFNASLRSELKLMDITNIGVHMLSPGMCTTELLMNNKLNNKQRFFVNCLAEPPNVPAQFLVPLVRAVVSTESQDEIKGQSIEYMTKNKAYIRILKASTFYFVPQPKPASTARPFQGAEK